MHYFNSDVLHAKGTTATKDDAKKFANLLGETDPKLDRVVREKLDFSPCGPVAPCQLLWQSCNTAQTDQC
jgi:hypothetical protein